MVLGSVVFDWTVVTAVTNIVLSILTLIALLITVYTVRINSFPKGKVMHQTKGDSLSNQYQIKLVNKRSVPITISHRGFYVIKDKGKPVLISESKIKKLEWSDYDYFSINEEFINEKLLKMGHKIGIEVKVFGFFKTSANKTYKIKITHLVKENYEPELILNSSYAPNAD